MEELYQEVESTLAAIDAKYGVNCPVLKKNKSTNELIKSLYSDFESLGIEYGRKSEIVSMPDVLHDVIWKSFDLIRLHRQLLDKYSDSNIQCATLKERIITLKKRIDRGEKVLEDKKLAIENIRKDLVLKNSEMDDVIAAKNGLQQELNRAKKCFQNEVKQLQQKIRKQECEKERLKMTNGQSLGGYISRDTILAETLEKYKENEKIYQDTIQKLQENNAQLIEEILNLKQEVLTVMIKAGK